MSPPVGVQPVMLMYAFRYALGRQSYAVGDVADTLIRYYDELRPDWREQIMRDIEVAVREGRAGGRMEVETWQGVARVMQDGPGCRGVETVGISPRQSGWLTGEDFRLSEALGVDEDRIRTTVTHIYGDGAIRAESSFARRVTKDGIVE